MPQLMRYAALVGAALTTAGSLALQGPASQLFAFHMTQHLLLIALAAPLLVLGGIEGRLRPVYAWAVFVGVFLFWHWPAVFQWAAASGAGEVLELGSISFAAWLFWSAALGRGDTGLGGRALFVMTGAVAIDLPGVVMVFAPRAFCTMPLENAAAFGLTPLEDQQIAGLLMWVPANLVFFGIATWLLARWMADPKTPSRQLVTS